MYHYNTMSSLFIRADCIITIYDQRNVPPVRNAIRTWWGKPYIRNNASTELSKLPDLPNNLDRVYRIITVTPGRVVEIWLYSYQMLQSENETIQRLPSDMLIEIHSLWNTTKVLVSWGQMLGWLQWDITVQTVMLTIWNHVGLCWVIRLTYLIRGGAGR